MQIKLKNLMPNPYRDIGNYPIDKTRIAKLQGSILNTEFWGGLVCRKHPTKKGFYQIAFGHHRIKALKNLKYTEILMKVLDYTDAQMLQAMAEENREIGQHDIKIMTQTVEQVKKYLDDELAKYETLKLAGKFASQLFENQQAFANAKRKDTGGVGRDTILKFLGKTWKEGEIKFALDVLKDDKKGIVNREAVESFKNKYQATQFKAAVKKAKIPVKKQKEIAKKIKPKVSGGRAIEEEVYKYSALVIPKAKKTTPKELPMLDDFVKDMIIRISDLHGDFIKVKDCLGNIQSLSVLDELVTVSEELLTEMKQTLKGAK